jgi:hypothetical protein
MNIPRVCRHSNLKHGCLHLFRAFAVYIAFSTIAAADPGVEGFDLVSSVRSGRTTFDYTYTLRVQADSQSYSAGTFAVTSSRTATQVTQGTVAIGAIDAGTFFRTGSTFTIRQDRTAPFDPNALAFKFSGSVIGVSGGLQIGPAAFLVPGGRPLHEGTFPLEAVNPAAGTAVILKADIFGAISTATFQLLSTGGQPLASGALSMATSSLSSVPRYVAAVSIPSQAFQIQITATGTNGSSASWTSATVYNPAAFDLQITVAGAEVAKGAQIPTKILLVSNTAVGTYNVSLLLPTGLSASSGPWSVSLAPGQTLEIDTVLTSPTTGNPFTLLTFSALASAAGSSTPQQTANLTLLVE